MLFLSRLSAGRPLRCLSCILLATAALAAVGLPRLALRTDGAVLHPVDDAAARATDRDRFQDPEQLVLLLTPRTEGTSLASAEGLRRLVEVHRAVSELPGIRATGVRSAASLVDVASSGVTALGTFLDEIPDRRAEVESLWRRLHEAPWTGGLFLAPDGGAAAVYAPLEPGWDRREVVETAQSWAAARRDPAFEIRLTGPVVAETLLGERILEDLRRLVPVMVLVVGLLLLICLRTPGGLVVALTQTLVVLVWTAGFMGLTGTPITLVTTILPVLLLALCVTDEIHVIARLQVKLAGGGRAPGAPASPAEAILETLGELYRPVVYTSFSTAIGFLSFLSTSLLPMRHFGAFAALGILLAMLMSFALTPALVVLLPRSWFVPHGPRFEPPARLRQWTGRGGLIGRYRGAALLGGLLLLAAGLPGLVRTSVQDSWIDNFDPASALVQAEREFDEKLWGTYRLDLVLEGAPGFFHRPDGAAMLAEAARRAGDAPRVAGVVTALEPLDTVAELLGLGSGSTQLPAEALTAVVQVAAAYAEKTDLHRLLTPDGRAARLLLVVDDPDYETSRRLAEHIEREISRLGEPGGVSFHTSGDIPLAVATVRAIVHNQLRSVAWTLVGVGFLLLLVNGKVRLTLAQLAPPVAAAVLILSGMGYAGLPLGIATSMFTALTVGVGVDLALHLTYAFERLREGGLGGADAIEAAIGETAAGRRWSTLVLSLGFLVLATSAFGPNHDLGILLSAAMLASYLTTSLFVPRMLVR